LIALILGILIPRLLNLFIREEMVRESSFNRFSDFFGLLLYQSQCEDRQVAIDLRNHKVYIGLCVEFIPPGEHDKGGSILLQPVASGYRDSSTHQLVLTTEYSFLTRSLIDATDEAERYFEGLSNDYETLARSLNRDEKMILEKEVVKASIQLENARITENLKLRDLQIALLSSEIIAIRFFDKNVFNGFRS